MKKFLKISSIVILSIFILLLVLPFLFKGKIRSMIDEEINSSVNAKVEYSGISLSLIRNFPNIHLEIDDLSISGREKFEGDTLIAFDRFSVVVDVSSVFSDVIQVNDILIDHPSVHAIVLSDSTANWDIMKDTGEQEEPEDTTSSGKSVRINSFRIVNGDIVYDDRTMDLKTDINGLTLSLSGDLSEKMTELTVNSSIDNFTVGMEGAKYLNRVKVGLDAKIKADTENMLFTFLDNELTLNGLAMGIEGNVQMKDESIGTDLTISAKKSDLKALLALVPKEFMTDFEDVQTSGDFHFVTTVKGDYIDSDHLPAFNVDLSVNNGKIKYPDLPESIDAINIHCVIDNPGGSADATVTDIENFHFELAGNPFDAGMKITTPVSNLTFSGKAKGTIDLGSLEKAVPLDSFEIRGMITTDIVVEGDYEMIDKEEYEKIKSTGSATMKNFFYSDADLPAGVHIDDAVMTFSPRYLKLTSFKSRIGKSDFNMKGKLENYLAYALKDGVLKGTLSHYSRFINANELMAMSSDEEEAAADTIASTLVEVPKNIYFVLTSKIDKILYDKLVITDTKGKITIRNGNVVLDGLDMALLDGRMNLTGKYSTENIKRPFVDFNVKVSDVDINKAAYSFSVVDSLMPIAKAAQGRISAGFKYSSLLTKDAAPVISSVNGGGNLKSSGIEIAGTKVQNTIASLLKNNKYKQMVAKDLDINFKLDRGGIIVEPFTAKVYGKEIKIHGRQGLDKSLDYEIVFPLSRKDMAGIAGFLGGVIPPKGGDIPVGVIIKGNFNSPELSLDLDEAKKIIGKELENKANDAIDNLMKDKNVQKTLKKLGKIFK